MPTTVVTEDSTGLLLWLAGGTPVVRGLLADGRTVRDVGVVASALLPRRSLRPRQWRGTGILMLIPPAEDWSLWWFFFFRDDGSFMGWYGNLEDRQVRRVVDGVQYVDTADNALDVWFEPDRSWSWKDEDEFADLTGLPGYWTAAQAPHIRAAGERLITLAESGAPPFDGRWTDFRPDPSWPLPTLPPHWHAA
ncbi:DUF402 domain-containing protein [Fodinicola feengrottensis]|uniref:DUF402 domain-containing protein n=1 Tax=Fodinicola feengrottensis TaxID=435914 RepID=UPI002442C1AA|nr:DUF402 domain-containing protein [Fodinicola feengrottensis]